MLRPLKPLWACLPLFLLAACSSSAGDPQPGAAADPPLNVRTVRVETSSLVEYLDLSGPVRPLRATLLSSEEAGRVESLAVDRGDHVAANAVLLGIDRRLLAAELKAAEADQRLTEYNEQRVRKLFEANSVSGLEMTQAESQRDKAAAAAEITRLRHQRATVRAPYAGLVTDRFVELGELIAPGTPVLRLVDHSALDLHASLTEAEIGYLHKGMPAQVELDGHGGTLRAEVHWVGYEASPTTGKFYADLRIDNGAGLLRPGVVGRARVIKRTHDDAIVVPREAVVMSNQGPAVFVADQDKAWRRPVQLGPDQGARVIVREGLQVGEALVIQGQRNLMDGDPVKVQGSAAPVPVEEVDQEIPA